LHDDETVFALDEHWVFGALAHLAGGPSRAGRTPMRPITAACATRSTATRISPCQRACLWTATSALERPADDLIAVPAYASLGQRHAALNLSGRTNLRRAGHVPPHLHIHYTADTSFV
jgi:hypothetical protein